jgi:hypothetical protein
MSAKTVRALEKLGRVRLSPSFSNMHGVPNIPEDPDLAIEVGKHLCLELLEPLNATFDRVAIRSAYRSPTVNALGSPSFGMW